MSDPSASIEQAFPGSVEVPNQSVNGQLARMFQQARKEYPGWNPDKQPQVGGTIVDVVPNCNCGGYGEHYIINIDQPDSTGMAVHCFHTVLKSIVERRIAGNALRPGYLIVVAYLGQLPSKVAKPGQSDAYNYNVVVQPPERYAALHA